MLARLPWQRRWLKALTVQLIAMAVVFAGIGIYQWVTRDVFWNPKVIISNVVRAVLPRQLALLGPLDLRALPRRRDSRRARAVLYGARRDSIAAAVVVVALWVGLVFSFSQSSFVALVAGVLGAIALSWERRSVSRSGVAVVALARRRLRRAVRARGDPRQHRPCDGKSVVARDGKACASPATTPLGGVGLGGFKSAYGERVGFRAADPARAASHNTPVTVAAELGVPGLLLFAWLVATALWLPFRRASRSFAGRASLCFGLALLAILVHSLFYNAFFEDPMSWGLLGLTALGYAWRSSTRASRGALERQVEAEREQHERVGEDERDRDLEAVDEPADDRERAGGEQHRRYSAPLVRHRVEPLRVRGHHDEHERERGQRGCGRAADPVAAGSAARLSATSIAAAEPVITQLNCVRRSRPIPIATTV